MGKIGGYIEICLTSRLPLPKELYSCCRYTKIARFYLRFYLENSFFESHASSSFATQLLLSQLLWPELQSYSRVHNCSHKLWYIIFLCGLLNPAHPFFKSIGALFIPRTGSSLKGDIFVRQLHIIKCQPWLRVFPISFVRCWFQEKLPKICDLSLPKSDKMAIETL